MNGCLLAVYGPPGAGKTACAADMVSGAGSIALVFQAETTASMETVYGVRPHKVRVVKGIKAQFPFLETLLKQAEKRRGGDPLRLLIDDCSFHADYEQTLCAKSHGERKWWEWDARMTTWRDYLAALADAGVLVCATFHEQASRNLARGAVRAGFRLPGFASEKHVGVFHSVWHTVRDPEFEGLGWPWWGESGAEDTVSRTRFGLAGEVTIPLMAGVMAGDQLPPVDALKPHDKMIGEIARVITETQEPDDWRSTLRGAVDGLRKVDLPPTTIRLIVMHGFALGVWRSVRTRQETEILDLGSEPPTQDEQS